MPYTVPQLRTTGEIINSASWNAEIRENFQFLVGNSGCYIGLNDHIRFPGNIDRQEIFQNSTCARLLLKGGSATTGNNAYLELQGANYSTSSGLAVLGGRAIWLLPASGGVFINESSNADNSMGLTINQGAADDEIIALKSSDIAHGMTGVCETDTFGRAAKISGTQGGIRLEGLGEGSQGAQLTGYVTSDDTTKSTVGFGAVELRAAKKSGTGVGNMGSDANLVVITNFATTRFIFDAEGSAHADVEWVTFDTHDDTALLETLDAAAAAQRDPLKAEFLKTLAYDPAEVERQKLAHFDRERPGHVMLNTTRLHMLEVGALRQQGQRQREMERRLTEQDATIARLTSAVYALGGSALLLSGGGEV